jgi:hypothetical protein
VIVIAIRRLNTIPIPERDQAFHNAQRSICVAEQPSAPGDIRLMKLAVASVVPNSGVGERHSHPRMSTTNPPLKSQNSLPTVPSSFNSCGRHLRCSPAGCSNAKFALFQAGSGCQTLLESGQYKRAPNTSPSSVCPRNSTRSPRGDVQEERSNRGCLIVPELTASMLAPTEATASEWSAVTSSRGEEPALDAFQSEILRTNPVTATRKEIPPTGPRPSVPRPGPDWHVLRPHFTWCANPDRAIELHIARHQRAVKRVSCRNELEKAEQEVRDRSLARSSRRRSPQGPSRPNPVGR